MKESHVKISTGESGTMIDGTIALNGTEIDRARSVMLVVGPNNPPLVHITIVANTVEVDGAVVEFVENEDD